MTTHTLFATCPRGLETILAQELQQQGCTAVTPTDGGVSCQGTMAHVYSANLHSRTASRILLQLATSTKPPKTSRGTTGLMCPKPSK